MGASTVGRQQRVVLAPLRYDMRLVLTPQNTTRAIHSGANQINFSAGVTPDNPPPPAINVVNAAPPPPAVNVQNIIPYVPPDDEIQAGAQPEVSLIAVSINTFSLHVGG